MRSGLCSQPDAGVKHEIGPHAALQAAAIQNDAVVLGVWGHGDDTHLRTSHRDGSPKTKSNRCLPSGIDFWMKFFVNRWIHLMLMMTVVITVGFTFGI